MQISKNKVVTMNIQIKDEDGQVIEDTFAKNQPLSYMQGIGQILPGLEEGLENKNSGDDFNFDIPAEKAFGMRHDANIQEVPRAMFDQVENIQEGMVMKSVESGREVLFTIKTITEGTVTIDANHPLAGKSISVNGNILEVREPTDEELQAVQNKPS